MGHIIPYILSQYETMYFGYLIDFTYKFGYSSCYQVNTDGGVHWHLEAGNASAVGNYACFYARPAGTALYGADYLGLVGANTTTVDTAC